MKCQAIIAGVGGQGVLFAARIFTEMASRKNLPVLSSQTFGMAQRGGSVMSHLKIGGFNGPLVCEGDADVLLGLDCVEAHRTLPYLRPKQGGKNAICVVNVPSALAFPDQRVAGFLREMGVAENIQYDVVPCDVRAYPEACRISGDCLAKGNRAAARYWLHARRPASVASSSHLGFEEPAWPTGRSSAKTMTRAAEQILLRYQRCEWRQQCERQKDRRR